MAVRVHLFPFRTQKLSSFVPTILGGRLPGKIGNANTMKSQAKAWLFFFGFLFVLLFSAGKFHGKIINRLLQIGFNRAIMS